MNNILKSKIDIASNKLSRINDIMDSVNDIFKKVESELRHRKINIYAQVKFKIMNDEDEHLLIYNRIDGEFRIYLKTINGIVTFWENLSRELKLEIFPFLLLLLEQIIENIDKLFNKANETIPKIKELIE
jgi:hypothetical protein